MYFPVAPEPDTQVRYKRGAAFTLSGDDAHRSMVIRSIDCHTKDVTGAGGKKSHNMMT